MLTRTRGGGEYAEGRLPANWDALQAVAPTLPSEYGPMLQQLPASRARVPLWIEYYVNQLNPAQTAVVTGQKTPRQALEDVQTAMLATYAEVFGQ